MSNDNSMPAFPGTEENGLNNGCPGLSMRDYFAAKAMTGIITATDLWHGVDYKPVNGLSIIENDTRLAYKYADAMLKAREDEP